ncbi:hypothetical protein J3R82DRAFT_9171 [Butyriboletus roseoflavus]|nr:hypothetical protein J3R82DRAFT_9171 [Butyriboletus roseoflavus]
MDWIPLRTFSRKLRTEYTVLPTDLQPTRSCTPHWKRRRCRVAYPITLRRLFFCFACTPIVVLVVILCHGFPPSYDDVRAFERRLPQHSLPNDRAARYLRFPGHLWGHGLNNILQEALLMSYLAYVSNVSFVFEDYTWSHVPLPWTIYGSALRPTRIPINAIISGPTAGGPMPDAPQSPLAVSAEFYERICSGPDTTPYVLSSVNAPNDADGTVMINWWRQHLVHVDAQCIEIDSSAHDLFDRFFFGGPRILSLFDSLAASPILRDFSWSPLVQSVLARNFALLQPRSANTILSSDPTKATLDGLLAVHLRRGDYVRHCPNLAKWDCQLHGHQPTPIAPRPLRPACAARRPRRQARLLPRALSPNDGTARRAAARDPGTTSQYTAARVRALERVDVGARQPPGRARGGRVVRGVDMAIAERAEVFVGNGFSSLSSNVAMLRLAKGMDPTSIRFL